MMRALILVSAATGLLMACFAHAGESIVRRGGEAFPIASSVRVPATAETVYVSGLLPDMLDADAPVGAAARFGDTATQTRSVIAKIKAELAAIGWGLGDIVKMNVYLVGDPAREGRMDFAGLMVAYRESFGTAAQPRLPARTVVQVSALPIPGALVEIEVVAARVPPPPAGGGDMPGQ